MELNLEKVEKIAIDSYRESLKIYSVIIYFFGPKDPKDLHKFIEEKFDLVPKDKFILMNVGDIKEEKIKWVDVE